MADAEVRRAVGPGPLHTDDRRQLEFLMPRLLLAPQHRRYSEIGSNYLFASGFGLPVDFSADPDRAALAAKFADLTRLRNEFLRLELSAMTGEIDRVKYLEAMEAVTKELGNSYPGMEIRVELVEQIIDYAADLGGQGKFAMAEQWAKRAQALDPDNPIVTQAILTIQRHAAEGR